MRYACGVLTVLIAAGLAGAEEKTVSVDVVDQPLAAVVAKIAEAAGITVTVDPGLRDRKITLKLEKVPAKTALERVTRIANVELAPLGESAFWLGAALEPWELEIRRTLEKTRVNVLFEETSLADALEYCAQMSGVTFVVDPDLARSRKANPPLLTLGLEQVKVAGLLDLIGKRLDLAWDVRWGVLFVASKKRMATLPEYALDPPPTCKRPEWEIKIRSRLRRGNLTFSLAGTPLPRFLKFLTAMTQLQMKIDEPIRSRLEKETVSLMLKDMRPDHILHLLLVPRGLRYAVTKEGLVIEERR